MLGSKSQAELICDTQRQELVNKRTPRTWYEAALQMPSDICRRMAPS